MAGRAGKVYIYSSVIDAEKDRIPLSFHSPDPLLSPLILLPTSIPLLDPFARGHQEKDPRKGPYSGRKIRGQITPIIATRPVVAEVASNPALARLVGMAAAIARLAPLIDSTIGCWAGRRMCKGAPR